METALKSPRHINKRSWHWLFTGPAVSFGLILKIVAHTECLCLCRCVCVCDCKYSRSQRRKIDRRSSAERSETTGEVFETAAKLRTPESHSRHHAQLIAFPYNSVVVVVCCAVDTGRRVQRLGIASPSARKNTYIDVAEHIKHMNHMLGG